jgi:hypothetical protein
VRVLQPRAQELDITEGICLPNGHPAASELRANCDAPAKALCER